MINPYKTLVNQFTILIQVQFKIQAGISPIFESKILTIKFI